MKAKNENGNIVVYSEQQFENQFNFYNNTHLWHLSDSEVLEAEGFFDVVVPIIQEGERLGAIYFDEENSVFTYPVEVIPEKTSEELEAEYQATIPRTISQRQLRTQLVMSGFDLATIELAIDSLPEPNKTIASIAWKYAVTFERSSELLTALAMMLGINSIQLDEIFINANQL